MFASIHRTVQVGDDNIGTGREEGGTSHSVFRRVIAQDNFNGRNGVVLVQSQFAGDGIAGESIDDGIGLVTIDAGETNGSKIADLGDKAPANEGRSVGR